MPTTPNWRTCRIPRSRRSRRHTVGSGSPPRAIRPPCAASIPYGRRRSSGLATPSAASRQKRWVLTQFPTAASAQAAGMTPEEYEAFVIAAMFLDRPDPTSEWRRAGPSPGRVGGVHVGRSIDPDRGRGHRPGPLRGGPYLDQLRRPAEHAVRRDLHRPRRRFGQRPAAVRVSRLPRWPTSWWASSSSTRRRGDRGPGRGGGRLLDGDARPRPGARRLGELGLGLNSGIGRFTGSILFDEKIGGTVHLALGESYPETGGRNTPRCTGT